MRKFLKINLVLFVFTKSFACDVCGNFMGLTPYDNQSFVTFLHRYRVFNGYRNYQQIPKFSVPGGYYKTTHDPNASEDSNAVFNHSSHDYETYKVFELRAKYFLHPRWEMNLIFPLQQIKTKYNDDKSSNTGFADPSLFAAYHLIKRLEGYDTKQRLMIGAGIKFPLGNDEWKNKFNHRADILVQNGTGSWDGFYYLNYILSIERFGFSANSLYKVNGKNQFNERFANSFNQIVNVFAKFQIKNVRLFPAALLSYEYCKGLLVNNHIQNDTKVNVLLFGPSCDLSIKNITINASYQFNIYERVSSHQLSNAGRLIVGLTFNFNQTHYLFARQN